MGSRPWRAVFGCNAAVGAAMVASALALVGCESTQLVPPDPQAALLAKGRKLFFEETFGGNGRTCGTCHPAENNFTIDSRFIAGLPPNDPLFVAETNPTLARNFENPRLMREFGLILENLDGFDDLANKFAMRSVPHTLGMRFSIDSPQGPRTGWSGDGAPGDGSLRAFAIGAVIQHFTKSLNRVAGVDFRLPTPEELDALEAFQLSLGRREELKLPLPLKGVVAQRGQQIFLAPNLGKCNFCHGNAGANVAGIPGLAGNQNFNTGVEDLPDSPAKLTGEKVPRDDGLGMPGDRTFNTPSLVEAADTPPFFHNNAVATLEAAVDFYNGDSFNNSPAGRLLAGATGSGIKLDATQSQAVASFLRVINALENIRQAAELLQTVRKGGGGHKLAPGSPLRQAIAETGDALRVLAEADLHPQAALHLERAQGVAQRAMHAWVGMDGELADALSALAAARRNLVQ